jgi:hypothetical protein
MTTLVDVGRSPLYPMPGRLPPRPRPRPPVRTLRSPVPVVSMIRPRASEPNRPSTSMGVTTANFSPAEPTGEAPGSRQAPPTGLGGADGRPPPAGA